MPVQTSTLFYATGPASVGAIVFDLLLEETHSIKSRVTQHPIESGSAISDHIVRELRSGTLKGLVSNFSIGTARNLVEVAPDLYSRLGPSWGRAAGGLVSGAGLLVGNSTAGLPASQRIAVAGALGAASQVAGMLALSPTLEDVKAGLSNVLAPANRAKDAWELFKKLWTDEAQVDIMTGLEPYKAMVVTDVSTLRNSETGESLEFDVQFTEVRIVSTRRTSISAKVTPKLTSNDGLQASANIDVKRTTGTGKTSNAAKKALTTAVPK